MNNKQRLILIGGIPGSGKTYFGARIAHRAGVFLDKDTICHDFTESLIRRIGTYEGDRESPSYMTYIRPLEYKTITEVAVKNLEIGHTVVCTAPFLGEFYDPKWVDRMRILSEIRNNTECLFVWMNSDESSLHTRITNRGEKRDEWKLNHWEDWYAPLPKSPPLAVIEDLIVFENRKDYPVKVQEQVMEFFRRFGYERPHAH